jgi:hypothetical protein
MLVGLKKLKKQNLSFKFTESICNDYINIANFNCISYRNYVILLFKATDILTE